MADTFNALRGNDLIWSFFVSNYLMGKEPRPFDLLFWNADQTRMPKALHLFYLRNFYKDNALTTGKLSLGGERLDLSKVKVPIYVQSSKEDHIAPYRSVYRGAKAFGGPVTFTMAGSGHIAGVINQEVPALDQRGPARRCQPMDGRGDRASRLVVAALGRLAQGPLGRRGSGARSGQGQAEAAGRRAWQLCAGEVSDLNAPPHQRPMFAQKSPGSRRSLDACSRSIAGQPWGCASPRRSWRALGRAML
jgi:hypothetical protein